MDKEIFETIEIEVIEFDECDVITGSNELDPDWNS